MATLISWQYHELTDRNLVLVPFLILHRMNLDICEINLRSYNNMLVEFCVKNYLNNVLQYKMSVVWDVLVPK